LFFFRVLQMKKILFAAILLSSNVFAAENPDQDAAALADVPAIALAPVAEAAPVVNGGFLANLKRVATHCSFAGLCGASFAALKYGMQHFGVSIRNSNVVAGSIAACSFVALEVAIAQKNTQAAEPANDLEAAPANEAVVEQKSSFLSKLKGIVAHCSLAGLCGASFFALKYGMQHLGVSIRNSNVVAGALAACSFIALEAVIHKAKKNASQNAQAAEPANEAVDAQNNAPADEAPAEPADEAVDAPDAEQNGARAEPAAEQTA
jgi:hypothetical protein